MEVPVHHTSPHAHFISKPRDASDREGARTALSGGRAGLLLLLLGVLHDEELEEGGQEAAEAEEHAEVASNIGY